METFPSFEELHVYRNEHGDVVLKQIPGDPTDEAQFVYIPVIHISAVIRAMRNAAKEQADGGHE